MKKAAKKTKKSESSCANNLQILDDLANSIPPANKGGRPSKYESKYNEMVIEHMAQGLSVKAFAGVAGVNRDTIYEWQKRYPDFAASVEIGLAKSLLFWEKLGIMIATGAIKGNATTWAINMHNRFKEDWKQFHDEDKGQGNEITVKLAYERPKPQANVLDDDDSIPTQ